MKKIFKRKFQAQKNKITKLKLKSDTKKQIQTNKTEILKNKNIDLSTHLKISKKLNKNMNKIYKRRFLNQNKLNKDKKQFVIK